MAKNLKGLYSEWVELNRSLETSTDCGEEAVRVDFSNYAGLENIITFEQMFELEKEYNK